MVMSPFMKLDLSQRTFRQVQGVDYAETFSLVAMLRVCWNYISDYCNLADRMSKHCFLNDFLEERLYVIQPEGFVNPEIC